MKTMEGKMFELDVDKNDRKAMLYVNEKKQDEKGPAYTGWLCLDGEKYRIAGWLVYTKTGKKCLQIKVNDWDFEKK